MINSREILDAIGREAALSLEERLNNKYPNFAAMEV